MVNEGGRVVGVWGALECVQGVVKVETCLYYEDVFYSFEKKKN